MVKVVPLVTGGAVLRSGGAELLWLGAHTHLFLVFGSALVPIDHPSASGTFATLAEAKAAAERFFAAG